MPTVVEVKAIVEGQLARISELPLRETAMALLIEPQLREVPWEYGGATENLVCWIVGNLRPLHRWVIAYSENGFGPSSPFGFIDGDLSSMGMDAQWFTTLEAALRSTIWSGRDPPGYEASE